MTQGPKIAPLWQTPVGSGQATIGQGDDAWYAYPGSGGTSFYHENGRYHLGEDWNREGGEMPGDMAFAFGAGQVVFDGVMSGYGNTVIIDHGAAADGRTHLFSLYAHLATADNFGSNLSVAAGQAVGQIGASGGTYAVHLHFELFDAPSWAAGVNLSGGSALDAEVEAAQSVTFDAQGQITSVVLTGEVDATRAGREYIRAFTSECFMTASSGRDRWYDGQGDDRLVVSGSRPIEAFGLEGNDSLQGGSGNDLLAGGSGQDRLTGGKGGDEIYGDAGDDWLNGVPGQRDDLQGGLGADTLISAGQGDVMMGWSCPLPSQSDRDGDDARDVFRFVSGSKGQASILDFEDGTDRIDLKDLAAGLGDLAITATARGARIVVGGLTITLEGVAAGDLGAGDFLF